MQFTRLRLSGFKSFVEPAELVIESGLTGIVGPNGCGKSNLVDALRWVMGEGSARQLRGREMDDVIFAGSATRPPRNVAEVTVVLDNTAGNAPPAFADAPEIQVSRRIERGRGSLYRVNGREVRARDVHLLFADETTGARSTALVSQGQIGALIAAKPAERRGLLEEAAGVTGLHGRRHEAELRLAAAAANLERLDDVIGALDTQLQGLRRQARQAARYRRLSERIRRTEAALMLTRLKAAAAALAEAEAGLAEAEREVARRQAEAAALASARAEAAAVLPPKRSAEAEAGARAHRLEVAAVALDAEERRIAEARQALEARLAQIDADSAHEAAQAEEAADAVARLDAEAAALAAARATEDGARREARERLAATAEALATLERTVDEAARRVAAIEAERAARDRETQTLIERRQRLARRREAVAAERAALAAPNGGPDLADLEAAVASAAAELGGAEATLAEAEAGLASTRTAESEGRQARSAAEAAMAACTAEAEALAAVLGDERGATVLDALTVAPGFETALGAALGDDLAASTEPGAPVHWAAPAEPASPPPLPVGARPLGSVVGAPPALAWRLSQIGIVGSTADGERLSVGLAQGQRLVGRDGALWRWDGLRVAAEAPTAAALRLRQRNRLAVLAGEIAAAERARDEAAGAHARSEAALAAAAAAEAAARAALREARAAHERAREAHARAAAAAAAAAARAAALAETEAQIAAEDDEIGRRLAELSALGDHPPDAGEAEALAAHRRALDDGRRRLAEAEGARDRVEREARARRERLATITQDLASWRRREARASAHRDELAGRAEAAHAELAGLAERPQAIAAERTRLFAALEAANAARRQAADAVAAAEARLADIDGRAREAEAAAALAREDRIRHEGRRTQASTGHEQIIAAIAERLDCTPEALAALAGDEAPPPAAEVEALLARLVREREAIGAVNLRAEDETAEVERQRAALADERADLEAAIGRLHQAITRLDREAAARLRTALTTIDGHFATLFPRLFGGGRAHLSLVDSDDPLEAGLEIMARPPGKRPQTLSLLSGGEQALTALALLFAMFLTNPAPICVLDEVDAPLDDANVERFLDLVAEIGEAAATRFVVVTHHPMTMARMDRLFGLTMAERGVSQVVSVDLGMAEALRATG